MRRDVFQKLGGFDEKFDLGGYEDFDRSLRLSRAGYEKWLCGKAWIHHIGHQTFLRNGIPNPCITPGARNRRHFEEKYGVG